MEKLWKRLTHGKGGKYYTHKYNLKTSNCDKRRVQMQDIGNTLEIKRSMTQNNLVYTQTVISKPHGNCTLKIYKIHTQKRRSNPNPTVKLVIKSQEKRAEQEGKKKDLQNQIQNNERNGNKNVHIDNYLNHKWIKCPNQKTEQLNGPKIRPIYMHICTRDQLQIQRHIQTESEVIEKGISCKWKLKESWSSNTHIRQTLKTVTRDKEEHYLNIKELIQAEDTILNIYAPNIEATQYITQIY